MDFFVSNKAQRRIIRTDHNDFVRVALLQGSPEGSHFLPDRFRIGLDNPGATAVTHCAFEVYSSSTVGKLESNRHGSERVVPRISKVIVVDELLGPLAQELHVLNTAQSVID
jgi:hypothetical protein